MSDNIRTKKLFLYKKDMATIKPILRTTGESVKIYIRFLNGRSHDYKLKTDFIVNSHDWNKKNQRPKPNSENNKILKATLDKICSGIQAELNSISLQGLEPSKKWLENTYNSIVNKEEKGQNANIEYWIKFIIDNSNLFENSVGEKGLSKNRIKQYNTLLNTFKDYQSSHKYKIAEINQVFYDTFFSWLSDYKRYAHNTCKKYTDDLIAVAKHSRKYNIPISKDIDYIKKVKTQKTYTIVLEEHEIENISKAKLNKPHHETARQWFLLGIEIAQRVSDLLRLNESNIEYLENLEKEKTKCLIFKQKKSQETNEIIIPFNNKLEQLLKNGFPQKISEQRFNEYIKDICRIAKIHEPTRGVKEQVVLINGVKVRRSVEDIYPKWELITSHTMRKTATTHMYQVFGSQVMHITGHKKEETVNIYVNNDRSRKISQIQKLQKLQEDVNSKPIAELRVVKNSSAI